MSHRQVIEAGCCLFKSYKRRLIFLSIGRFDKGRIAVSLSSVTERIDNIVFGIVAIICLSIWAVLGFPFMIEIAAAAVLVAVIFSFLRWMESRQ